MTALSGKASACSAAAWEFARVEEFWREFAPLTPYGKDFFEARLVRSDLAAIEADCDDIEAYGCFASRARATPARIDKLAWHLRRIPRLPGFGAPGFVELFLFKKFLSNFKACADLLDAEARAHFGIEFASEELAGLLALGGADPDSFHIADAYKEALGPLRAKIESASSEIAQRYSALAAAAGEMLGVEFAGREFLVVPAEKGLAAAAAGEGRGVAVEPYDDRSYLVRCVPDAAILQLERRREALREEERALESEAAAEISASVDRAAVDFDRYAKAIARLDVARSRDALAERHGLRRPILGAPAMKVSAGRFIPLAGDCAAVGAAYAPISVELSHSAAVLSGSNMGGKTVALQSILFFQILAQSGMYVPAASYESKLYDFIEYVGEGRGGAGASRGLSGFGREIRDLSEILGKATRGACLVAFDEFARTTGSEEAEALLSEVVGRFAAAGRCTAIFATHLGRIDRDAPVHWLRMAGLDRKAARECFGASPADGPSPAAETERGAADDSRLRGINRLMRYEIIEDGTVRGGASSEDGAASSDALEVATLLGLDPRLVAGARNRLAKRQAGAEDGS